MDLRRSDRVMAYAAGGRVTRRPRLCVTSVFVIAGVLVALTGCSADEPDSGRPEESSKGSSDSPSPSATPASPEESAKQQAVSTYVSYWKEMEVLYATSTGQGASLKDFAASNALITAESDAKQMHDKGLLITGNVSVERATVTKIDVGRKVPNATVSSCLDISDWTVINGKTKKPAALPSERLTKYVVVSVVEKLPQGWRVIKDEPQAGQPC